VSGSSASSNAPKTKTAKRAAAAKVSEKSSKRPKIAPKRPKRTPEQPPEPPLSSLFGSLSGLTLDITNSAFRMARDTASKAIRRSPEQLRMMAVAGESLKDMREVAGLTLGELSDALNVKDKSVLEAIEDGREAMSIELILRLASLVARNDPLPFVLKYTRAYYPRLWEILKDLNLDQLPLQFERERQFINIYRRHDSARQLSEKNFDKVISFTQQAFDLAITFVEENESDSVKEPGESTRPKRATARKRAASKRSKNSR